MFNLIVGNIDTAAALVLVTIFAGATMITTSIIVKRRTVLEINNEFELAKMKQHDFMEVQIESQKRAHELALARLAADTEVNVKRIDSGMITSHSSKTEEQDG